ncbi:beta-1,4-glucuronyltransferase 1 [Chironomus tepperi]|uniref:beta-1,4-glucuronyltransferase 1 n=1 Tax=Chironomus tepperi TaxID=113505 RepID=UPI00391F5915
MITRRNWLLRCSIFANIIVLLYICSHVMIGSNTTNNLSGSNSFLIQQLSPTSNQQSTQRSSLSQAQIYQDEQELAAILHNKELELQKQLKIQDAAIQNVENTKTKESESKIAETIPEEDNRFEIPTDQSSIQQQQQQQQKSDVLFTDGTSGNNNNNNNNNNNANNSELFTTQSNDLETRLKMLLNCFTKSYDPYVEQRGDFWVLKNYVRAEHGELKCYESVTYTTHADYTFLDNLIPLLERWNAPISIALHAPGTDFLPTVNSIKYLRDCLPESNLVRQFVTFHIYFSSKHVPKVVPKYDKVLFPPYNCSLTPPFFNATAAQLYKTQKKLLYPVNVGRNVARDAALTHFILASDIELYTNPGFVRKFLEMIARNDAPLQRKSPRVFPLPIFEVDTTVSVPRDKTELQELLRTNKAIPFHKRVCASCHGIPKSKEWIAANETDELGVFYIGKRTGYFVHWEPIFVGTNADPHYDERLSWEGKSDKMTQGYSLCVLDYEFQILDNAFLVHKPGIKVLKKDPKRAMLAAKTNQLIKKIIYPELQVLYGTRKGCAV